MKAFRASWDTLLGTTVLGGAPLLTWLLISCVSAYICGDFKAVGIAHNALVAVATALTVVAPVVATIAAFRWRKRHRILPLSMLWVELPVGLLCGFAFLVALIVVWGFASIE